MFQAGVQNFEKQLLASPCLSVRPRGTSRLPLDGFSLNLIFVYFSKIFREDTSFFKKKFDKNNAYFT